MNTQSQIKDFYAMHSDEILEKRFNSPYVLRRYAHRTQYESLIKLLGKGKTILDAGCGEGVIPLLLAERGIASTGMDISEPNIKKAQSVAKENHLENLVKFDIGDAEHLPYQDASFDVVISSHVLEHLSDFDAGARELVRVAKERVVIALPTCLNFAAFSVLGNDHGFWKVSKRTPVAFIYGFFRVLWNLFGEGVQEGYAGSKELPHIWRYPWVMRRRLERATGWKIVSFQASTLIIPYVSWLLPLTRLLDRFRHVSILRNFGYGSIAVLEPRK